jgi:cellulose synthase/poly-beta-1,6-N-acetylglucosamine synthase-like glycosyltransferase
VSFLDAALWVPTAPVLLANSVVAIEILIGLAPARRVPLATGSELPRTVVLVPAHNEARVIGGTLARLQPILPPNVSVLIVADNCTDETAAVARSAGVEVIERADLERRGKGFALDHGRNHLAANPPQVVIVLDADCSTGAGDLAALAAHSAAMDAPVQACDLIRPTGGSPLVEISTFAFAVKNSLRQQGMQRIGAAPMLAGTGMAFPWRIFATAPLATGSITEDLKLGLDLLRAGERPRYLAQACVWSDPGDAATTMQQRSRWETGFLQTAWRRAIPTVLGGARRLSWPEFWAGLHLLAPPLALLCLLNLALALALGAAAALLGTASGAFAALLCSQALFGLALVAGWFRLGSRFLSPRTAIRLPLYVLWKVPLYLRAMTRRGPAQWVRADRSGPGAQPD